MGSELAELLRELTERFSREVSAARMLGDVRRIRRSDVWGSFGRYEETAAHLSRELERAGAQRVEILRFYTWRGRN